MSMNFNNNNSGSPPPTKAEKSNNNGIILAIVIGAIAATTIMFAVMRAQDAMEGFSSSSGSTGQGTTATVEIQSDTGWSGSVLDSSLNSATRQGTGNSNIVIDCSQGIKLYSLAIQKQAEYGTLSVRVVQDGTVLDSGSTNAAYGVVTLAGRCY